MKRQLRKRTQKSIRQNRPGWRKEIIGYTNKHSGQKPKKIKGKNYIRT